MKRLQHSDYMKLALEEAKKAMDLGEIPVGCIIVKDDVIISTGYNTRETCNDSTGHAEINAIKSACKKLKNWRLAGCTLYVTLEPCPMGMGAIMNSRIDMVVFGAYDIKSGCCGSAFDMNSLSLNHKTEILGGICELQCHNMLNDFFSSVR